MISVLLADDQALVRAGFRVLIQSAPDLEVVGEAATGDEAVAAARALHPNVVLMDIGMPGLDGIGATSQIANDPTLDETHVLILTTFESDENIFEALRAGASGFAVKDMEPADLLQAIRVIAEGKGLLAPTVTRRVIARFAQRPTRLHRNGELDALTEREREVLTLVAQGLTNEDIAGALVLSPATVKTHINRIRSKLAIHDRAQLVVAGYEAGLVVPGA